MNLREITSWEHSVNSSKEWTKEGPNGPNLFRGQADKSWSLSPSLARRLGKGGYDYTQARKLEMLILHEFQDRYGEKDAHCKTLRKNDLLSWWEVMQHHSAPTRLLDWSKSPYASLFFAVSSSPGVDGAFYIIDAGHLQWIQSTRVKEPQNKSNMAALHELNKSVNGHSYEKSMVVITAPFPTSRMNAQHSSFTLSTEILESHDIAGDDIVFGRCGNRSEVNPSILYKFTVPSTLKGEFAEALRENGLTKETLFPDSRVMDEDSGKFLKIIEQIITETP
jgi:hypothetical protein